MYNSLIRELPDVEMASYTFCMVVAAWFYKSC